MNLGWTCDERNISDTLTKIQGNDALQNYLTSEKVDSSVKYWVERTSSSSGGGANVEDNSTRADQSSSVKSS